MAFYNNIINCIECKKLEGPFKENYHCPECKRLMCDTCRDDIWKNWLNKENIEYQENFWSMWCTICWTLIAIKKPTKLPIIRVHKKDCSRDWLYLGVNS